MAPVEREWTVLLYTMANENKLRQCANQTLLDIARALPVSKDNSPIKVAAQVIFRSNVSHPIRRYDFETSSSSARKTDVQNGLQYLPRKDRGPCSNLLEFLHWGQQTYPAKQYCVVLQGHAWGADYTVPSVNLSRNAPGQVRGKARSQNYRLILGSPRSKNHLTNKDLQSVLTLASAQGKFHLLGMDSCLMSMAEICCQLEGCAEYTVAPEGLGPIRGWPFYPILMRLKRKPSIGPEALGASVLELYARQFRHLPSGVKLTIALCALRFADELVAAMQALVAALRGGLRQQAQRAAIVQARLQCAFFRIPTYIDLYTFCRLLRLQPAVAAGSPIAEACGRVESVLRGRFVHKVALQRVRADGHGLSIYFPKWRIGARQRPSPWKRIPWTNPMATPSTFAQASAKIDAAYLNHQFADRCGWREFLLEFLQARLVA